MIRFNEVQTEEQKYEMYRLRYDVYCHEQHFLDAINYPDNLEYDEYDEYSMHFLALDGSAIVGTARLIQSSPLGLPIENFFKLKQPDSKSNSYAEISRLIVHPQFRDSSFYIMCGLSLAMLDYSKQVGITHFYAVLEEFLYETFTGYGFPLTRVGKPEYCLGRVHSPFVVSVAEGFEYLKTNDPKLYEHLISNYESTL